MKQYNDGEQNRTYERKIMDKDFINLTIRVDLESPFHVGAGYGIGLLDRSICRDHQGYIYLPGSSLKGNIRRSCEDLAGWLGLRTCQSPSPVTMCRASQPQCIICRLFGSQAGGEYLYFDNAYLVEELRSQYTVRDFFKEKPAFQTLERSQIRIDRRLGTAKKGHLLSSEYGLDGMAFRGDISGYIELTTLDEYEGFSYEIMLLIAGLRLVQNIGLGKTSGHGLCKIKIVQIQMKGKTMMEEEARAFGDKLCRDIEFLGLYQENQGEGEGIKDEDHG